ncbi:FtsK/SpoIIIE domain-containing protein [Sinomonas sp. JGH33]|uniref:FtsK/SpoIIIE domain-containing protein n=1 Tax=Sinomonas terricola TaxID=3110330 RepID=A0ABU5T0C1_9MICC|nr:FtsK/SpoIIIE domain-containing protein [Sinomonas sp. JGH33]MEA5453098.1 FtsK/SpoIIIE domain-containing protein [Sinomonas sp. JGH33]
MELHFTLISPIDGRPDIRDDLVAEAAMGAPGKELASVLANTCNATGITVDGEPLESLTVGVPPLRDGALLLSRGAAALRHTESRLELVVRTGPAAGTAFPLARGLHVVGRSSDSDGPIEIPLPDPEASRRHARLIVTETSARIADEGSANGTWVTGRRTRSATLRAGDLVRIGSSTLSLEFADQVILDDAAGSHHGAPLRVEQGQPPRRGAAIAMVILPLIVGIGLAAVTGQWTFLAFSGLSIVTGLVAGLGARNDRASFRERLAQAIDQDLSRRTRAAPDAVEFCRAAVSPALAGAPRDDLVVRLGTAPQPADIIIEPADGGPLPRHAAAPMAIQLPCRAVVHGPESSVEGLVRFVLLQLASTSAASGLGVVVAGGSSALRLAARFLPRVTILPSAATERTVGEALPAGRGVVVILPPVELNTAAQLAQAAAARGLSVIDAVGVGVAETTIDLNGPNASLTIDGSRPDFAADLLPARPFETAARKLGLRKSADDGGTPPSRCGLAEIARIGTEDLARSWNRSRNTPGPDEPSFWIPLGRGAEGVVGLDLVAHGPHLLVAGTTGSGKSELLRTLVCSAAATHSPAVLTFLFIDFKGGSGLSPLAGLPHCVGVVSDLEGSITRTLTSLRAELELRERLFAEAGCADIEGYASSERTEPVPRLVIVVDEFRMLVDDAPESLAELLRVATIGRSLGLHLVMATQRPQGAISTDIRANVASTIVLRVANESESRDVLGTPEAARIPAAIPGRAFLATPGEPPIEFQTASLGVAAARGHEIRLMTAHEWLESGPGGEAAASASPNEASSPYVASAQKAWRDLDGVPPRRPVAEPLPDGAVPAPRRHGREVPLGIADIPHEQRTDLLLWSPEQQGHLAFVGAGSSGARDALKSTVAYLASATPERHLYILDADGTLAALSSHPRVGAYVGLGDVRLATRVLDRLGDEVACRRDDEGVTGAQPRLVLVISGWGSWLAAWRQGPQARAEERLMDLVRDGGAGGLVVALSGERDLAASRAFAGIPCRLFFPWGSPEEARLGWPRPIPGSDRPGRAIAAGTLAPDRPLAVHWFEAPSDLGEAAVPREPSPARPFRVRRPPDVVVAQALAAKGPASADGEPPMHGPPPAAPSTVRRRVRLTVGLTGDEISPLGVPLGSGDVLLVLGSPGSGKSSFLEALPAMNPGRAPWHIYPFTERDRTDTLAAVTTAIDAGEVPILVVDDADRLTASEHQRLRSALDAGAAVVATASFSPSLYTQCPLALRARRSGIGIAILPRSPSDGEAFGVRIDPPVGGPPGRAVVVVGGRTVDAQLGWAEPIRVTREASPGPSAE